MNGRSSEQAVRSLAVCRLAFGLVGLVWRRWLDSLGKLKSRLIGVAGCLRTGRTAFKALSFGVSHYVS